MAEVTASLGTSQATVWLLTYLIHSTVIIGGVWLVVRLRWVGDSEGREALWKTALVAGVLTASAQVAITEVRSKTVGERQLVWAARTVTEQVSTTGRMVAIEDVAASLQGPTFINMQLEEPGGVCAAALRGNGPLEHRLRRAESVCAGGGFDWEVPLLVLWGIGAALLVLRLTRASTGLRAALAGRVEVASGEAREILDELVDVSGLSGGVRLTASVALESPAVVARREICLPLRADGGLSRPELRVVLAHELGHIKRRDPMWTVVSRLAGALFFIQPLNRLAIREMEAEAEFLCDDWAVQQTGEPVTLARSLTRISEWLTSPPPAPVLAVIRDKGSPLLRRVQRLLAPPARRPRALRARVLGLVVVLVGLTAFIPRVRLADQYTIRVMETGNRSMADSFRGAVGELPSSERKMVFVRAVTAETPTP